MSSGEARLALGDPSHEDQDCEWVEGNLASPRRIAVRPVGRGVDNRYQSVRVPQDNGLVSFLGGVLTGGSITPATANAVAACAADITT
jgi:hypothetical protein